MEHLKEYIHSKRPNLSNSSLITYTSILKNLYHKVFGTEVDFHKFDDTESILHFLKDMSPNKRKTILSALVIITDKKEYRTLMMEDVRDYNKEISKQTKTPEQEASWVSNNEIKEIWDELKRNADLLYRKKTLTPHDLQQIQSYVIMSLLGGIFIPPRRSKDFVDFVIKDIDKNKDNYLEKNKMYFNSYKTAKTYGCQIIDLPRILQSILKKWIHINPTRTLLFDVNMNPLSSVKLNQRINKIFHDKKVSVNALRHSYLTDKYAQHSQVDKQLSKDMTEMGSSKSMADTYIKLN
jgi:hypothetical protein